MKKTAKTEQLQIRVSPEEKRAIVSGAKAAGMSMSDWMLSRALTKSSAKFRDLVNKLSVTKEPGYVLADINELLTRLLASQLAEAVDEKPGAVLSAYLSNYVTALVEQACMVKDVQAPEWVKEIKPLPKPVFATELNSLRMHLLLNAPPAFRNRNIFIDSSIGARV